MEDDIDETIIDRRVFESLLSMSNEMVKLNNIPLVTQDQIGVVKARDYYLSTGILIRIGETADICDQYENGYLKFGCPANWINYAHKAKDGIADKYESIIGHVKKDDPRLWVIADDGIPLNMFRSLWTEEDGNGLLYVRYLYHCLTPTICFYSMPISFMAKAVAADKKTKDFKITIDLADYKKALGFQDLSNKSALIISNPKMFFSDIQDNLMNSVSSCDNLLQIKQMDRPRILASRVFYDLDIEKEFFEISAFDDIFRKRRCFAKQREARLIIPHFYFNADPVYNKDSYLYNYMKVMVPNIKNYSIICNADAVNKLDFWGFSNDFKSYQVGGY